MKAMPHKKALHHMARAEKHNASAAMHNVMAQKILAELNNEKPKKKASKKKSKKPAKY